MKSVISENDMKRILLVNSPDIRTNKQNKEMSSRTTHGTSVGEILKEELDKNKGIIVVHVGSFLRNDGYTPRPDEVRLCTLKDNEHVIGRTIGCLKE